MIDLKKEQKASLSRPRYPYSITAKFFFWSMDLITGKQTTLSKTKLLEILASIPYRAWECHQYGQLTRQYKNDTLVRKSREIVCWGREAQDNEYWHLLVINEKMKADNVRDAWYLIPIIPFLMAGTYRVLSRLLAMVHLRRAFLFNAEFEDHAEHVYARFVEDHPEWDSQPVDSEFVKKYNDSKTWGDIFRRIALDERDHMNHSFVHAGRPESVVLYEGMPELPLEVVPSPLQKSD